MKVKRHDRLKLSWTFFFVMTAVLACFDHKRFVVSHKWKSSMVFLFQNSQLSDAFHRLSLYL